MNKRDLKCSEKFITDPRRHKAFWNAFKKKFKVKSYLLNEWNDI